MANSTISKTKVKNKIFIQGKNKYRHFTFAFFGSLLFLMLGVSFFNYVIDPYAVFNTFYLDKLNDVKPKKGNSERLFKAVAITKIQPKTVILGSSRVQLAINPEHPILSNNYQKPAYNAGISAANIYEVKRYLEHAIANQDNIDLVILGLDFFMFNGLKKPRPSFDEDRIGKKRIILKDALDVLLSLDSVNASWETIKESIEKDENEEQRGLNGFYPLRQYFSDDAKTRFEKTIMRNVYILYPDYELSSKNLEYFREIVDLCEQNNIQLITFISPSHATQWESIETVEKWDLFEEWKREIVEIRPVFDFSGYNTITTEKIDEQTSNYRESSHYTEKVGNLVIERIFTDNHQNIPSDFGVLITPQNIESHLQKIREDREKWIKNKPEDYKLVQEAAKSYTPK